MDFIPAPAHRPSRTPTGPARQSGCLPPLWGLRLAPQWHLCPPSGRPRPPVRPALAVQGLPGQCLCNCNRGGIGWRARKYMTNPMTTGQLLRGRAVHQSDDLEVARSRTTKGSCVCAVSSRFRPRVGRHFSHRHCRVPNRHSPSVIDYPANGRLRDSARPANWPSTGPKPWPSAAHIGGCRCPCPCRRCTRGVPAAYRGRTHGAANHSPYGAGQAERVVLPESVCLAGRYQMKTGEGEPNGASAAQDLPHPDAFNAARCLPAHPDRGTAAGGPAGLSPRQPKAACRPAESSQLRLNRARRGGNKPGSSHAVRGASRMARAVRQVRCGGRQIRR